MGHHVSKKMNLKTITFRRSSRKKDVAMQFIQDAIKMDCVVIFSKSKCPFCAKAKAVFEEMEVNYKVIEIDLRNDACCLQNTLEVLTDARTDTITQNRVVIFSKTTCPYCDIVKCIFSELHVPFKVIELDKRNDGIQLQYILTEMTNLKTVPKVFINGACIGGGSDTVMLHSKGRLLHLVNECTSDSSLDGRCVCL